MHDRRMKAAIRRGFDAANAPQPAPGHRDRLEADLLEAYHEHYPRHRRFLMLLNPWNRAARLAMAGLAVALLGVGACSTSTTTEVEMGQKLTIGLNTKSSVESCADLAPLQADLDRFFGAQPGVEGVSFNVRMMDGQTTFEVMAWGQDLDGAALESALREQVPALADATVSVEPMSGSVRENILSHFGHEYLGFEVSGGTAEEIRQQILTQMAAQGLDGDAQVQVEDLPDGRRQIKVEVRREETP
jgi:hypothetical protein